MIDNGAEPVIDLRSDTLSLPTEEMLRSILTARRGDDSRDGDPTARELEAIAAEMLGKAAALLTDSGTASNLIAMRSQAKPGGDAIVEESAHIYGAEQGGVTAACGLLVLTVPGTLGAMDPDRSVRDLPEHQPAGHRKGRDHLRAHGGRATVDLKRSVPVKLFVSALLLFFLVPAAIGQVVDHYKIEVEILPETEFLRADATISLTVPEQGLGRIRFFLNRGLAIRKLTSTAEISGFRTEMEKKGEYRYAPEAVPLTIDFTDSPFPGEKVELQLAYEGVIEADPWGVNQLSVDWIELGIYSGWFPFNPAYSNFTYGVDIQIDSSYRLIGPGSGDFRDGKWRFNQESPAGDIIFLGSRDLKIHDALDAAMKLQIAHAGLEERQIGRISSDALHIADQFSRWFRSPRRKDIRIVFAKRSRGGGYSRPGFVVTIFDGKEADYPLVVKSLAHEIAHFWWSGAPTTTWEDWLNESFAEYAALMWIRETEGEQAFQGYLEKYEKASADTPAVWGMDRDAEDAYGTLYRKGPLLLHRLEREIGWEKFFRFLLLLIDRKVESTAELLETLQSITSRSVRDTFESSLRR